VVPAFTGGGGFFLSNRLERAPVLPTAAGGVGGGRGLDAYRTTPIPVAGRGPTLATASVAARGTAPTAFSWLR